MLESIIAFLEPILKISGVDPFTMEIVEKVFDFIRSIFGA